MLRSMAIVSACILIVSAPGLGQIPVWHNTLEDAASSTINGGVLQGSAAAFVPGIVSPPLSTVNKFQSTGDSRVFWGTSAVQNIFTGWSDAAGITVDLYFSGFGPGVTRDSGLWSVGHRNPDQFLVIAVRDDTLRINIRSNGSGGTMTLQTGNLGLQAGETYRLTLRQHASLGNGGDMELYLDDLGGNVYSNAAPLATLNIVDATYNFNFPLTTGSGPALGMNIGSRHPFDASNPTTRLKAGESVDEVRIYNGSFTPAELDAGGLPEAVMTADITSGPAPLTVDFDGSGSFDTNGGSIVAWAWDFEGNGGTPDSVLADPPPYTYQNPGVYDATLTVTDNDNNTASTSLRINVQHRLAITAISPTGGPLTGSQPALAITSGGVTATSLIGPSVVEIIGAMNSEQNTGLCGLSAAASMLGIELGRGVSGVGAGEAIRGYFAPGVLINADGTPAPELFIVEYANTTDPMVIDLLTNGPGVTPVIAATVQYQASDYLPTATRMAAFSGANSPLGGMGIDLDALGITGITGVQLSDPTGAIDPVAIIAVDPPGTLIPPSVTMTATPSTGGFPLVVGFAACPAYDVDGPIVSIEWDFNNDGTVDATGPTTSHTYTAAGNFTAKVTVTDTDGLTASHTLPITVTGSNPKRRIIAMQPAGNLTGSRTLTSVTTEFPGGSPTFTATDLVGPPGPIDATLHVEIQGAMDGSGITQLGPTTDPKAAMVGLELAAGIAGLAGPGEALRAYFPDNVRVNPDGTDAPELFFIERSNTTDNFQIHLLTSGPGEPVVIAATVDIFSTDYGSTTTVVGGNPLGGVGIDLDALGASAIRGVQIPGVDILGNDTGVDPAVVAAIPTGCNLPFADADGDGDVDMDDFAAYQLCYTGPGQTALFDSRACYCFDTDGDSDVDEMDLNQFARCATGPGITWSQELAPNCNP